MSSLTPYADARALLKAASLVPPANIAWQNEPFQEPSGDPAALWLAVECVGTVLDPIEMGGGAWQEEGTLYVHVMVPAGSGTDAARTLAKQVANTFRGLGPRPVIYRGASIGNSAPSDPQGIWWGLTVTVDWIYQDVTTS